MPDERGGAAIDSREANPVEGQYFEARLIRRDGIDHRYKAEWRNGCTPLEFRTMHGGLFASP